jgi:DNA mismatch repair protein MutL
MDVNVHPTKQEVRFENPESVYNAVFEAVTEMLSGKSLVHRAERDTEEKDDSGVKEKYIPEPFEKGRKNIENSGSNGNTVKSVNTANATNNVNITNTVNAAKTVSALDIRRIDNNGTTGKSVSYLNETETAPVGVVEEEEIGSTFNSHEKQVYGINSNKIFNKIDNKVEVETVTENNAKNKVDNKVDNKVYSSTNNIIDDKENNIATSFTEDASEKTKYVQQSLFDTAEHTESREDFNNVFSRGYRIVGQIFETYWIVEAGGCAYIIDQHAAHEKILYEKFMKKVGTDDSTQLLSPPMIISLSSIEGEVAERYNEELVKNGFVLEHFGGHEYALSEIPLNLYGVDPRLFLLELLDELSKDIKGSVIKSIKEKIATCACKAAVKGNMELSEPEAKELLKQLLEAENPFNCPHGRPVIIDLTKREVEKKFKRIL